MKQFITVKQLNEIDSKKKLELAIKLENWNEYRIKEGCLSDRDIAEQVTIGKMIEILCKSDFCFPNIGLTESSTRNEYIVVGVTCLSGPKELYRKTFEGDELCDALWQAVKSIL